LSIFYYSFFEKVFSMDKEAFLIAQMRSPYIGDDAAVVGDTLYSADAFFEDTHFKRSWMTPAQIGRKAMLVNISDAIAMAAKPRYALVSVGIPRDMDDSEIAELVEAMQRTAEAYGCEIIGGDTVGSDKLHISITLVSRSDNPLLRKGLECGDLLAFTGTLGESKRNLEALFRGEKLPADARFFEPTLRDAFVYAARPYLRAGMDISDGLFCDVNKMLDYNDTGIEILKNISEEEGYSGEEYEMLVAFAPDHRENVERLAAMTNTPLTVFAEVAKNGFRFPCESHHFA
jgi:thiamine-monophosphate kinase